MLIEGAMDILEEVISIFSVNNLLSNILHAAINVAGPQ